MQPHRRWRGRAVLALLAAALVSQAAVAQRAREPRQAPRAPAQRAIDPRADAELRKMSDYLGRLPAFGVWVDHATEVVLEDGQKLEFDSSSRVWVRRPNGIRSDRRGEEVDASLYYDGRTMTVFGRRANLYASAQAPPTIDAAIDFARAELDVEAPAADLLYSNPYGALTEDIVSGMYVGEAEVDGTPCHHLAFRGRDIDFQIWIQQGAEPLPRKFVIVTKDVPSRPEFRVELRDWMTDPELVSADLFRFRPPAGAERTEFVGLGTRARAAATQGRTP